MTQRQEKTEEIDEKAKVLKKLDKLGIEWYEASQAGNEAEKRNLSPAIFNLIMAEAKVIKESWRTQSDDFFGAVSLFYCNDLEKYNPNYNGKKAPFSEFVRSRISLRMTDNYNTEHENKRTRKKQEDGTVVTQKRTEISIEDNEEKVKKEGTGGEIYNIINESNKMRDPALIVYEDADMCELISLFISLTQNLSGRKDNESKKFYFRLFGTENITGAIHLSSDDNAVMRKHERDIFSAMQKSFLDYYMLKECDTIREIRHCRMKQRKEVEKNSNDEREVEIPFSNKLYLAYFDRIEGKQIVDSTISNQRNDYERMLKALVKNDYKN